MPPKINRVWKDLQAKMSAKRTKQNQAGRGKSAGGAPRELVVQRLTSEPDNKQTYRPVQTREFVEFTFDELTLANLKSSCAAHFGLPVSTCDILVSNNGPSCMNINQIPHRKDKVSNECITVLDHFGYFHVLLYPLEGSFGLTTIIKGKQGSVESLPKIESIRVGPVLLSLREIWDQKRDFFHSKRDSDVTLDNVRQGRSGQQQQLHRNGRK